jgi:hypothetical protein
MPTPKTSIPKPIGLPRTRRRKSEESPADTLTLPPVQSRAEPGISRRPAKADARTPGLREIPGSSERCP